MKFFAWLADLFDEKKARQEMEEALYSTHNSRYANPSYLVGKCLVCGQDVMSDTNWVLVGEPTEVAHGSCWRRKQEAKK